MDAAVLDETSRLSTLTDDNTKTSAGKSDESGGDSSSEDEVQEKDEIPKVKDKKEATEIFKELLREKVQVVNYLHGTVVINNSLYIS